MIYLCGEDADHNRVSRSRCCLAERLQYNRQFGAVVGFSPFFPLDLHILPQDLAMSRVYFHQWTEEETSALSARGLEFTRTTFVRVDANSQRPTVRSCQEGYVQLRTRGLNPRQRWKA